MPLSDAAASLDAPTRLRSMVNLATPFALRVGASLQVADQIAAGVHDANAVGGYRGQQALVLLEYACAPH